MLTCKGRAARGREGLEFHEFDARQVRIKNIELAFAIAAVLTMFTLCLMPAMRFQFLGSVVDITHA